MNYDARVSLSAFLQRDKCSSQPAVISQEKKRSVEKIFIGFMINECGRLKSHVMRSISNMYCEV